MASNNTAFGDRLIKALSGEIPGAEVDALIAELGAAFRDPSREQAISILSSMARANVHIEGKGNIVGHGNQLVYIEGVGSAEIANALWQLRQWIAEDEAAEKRLHLEDKLLTYVANLAQDPEFADWDQQRYFELQLGKERVAPDIRMRLKASIEGPAAHLKGKYTVNEAIRQFRRLVIIGEPGSGKTTALRRLAFNFADRSRQTMGQGVQTVTEPLPIYIWLPHFNSVAGATAYDKIVALIRDAFQRLKVVLYDEDTEILVQDFYLILLLDGLNEIGDKNIDPFLDGLETFASNHDQHLFVITSRTHNFQFGKYDLPVLELLELTYPDDIEQYLRCYLSASSSDVRWLMQILRSNLQMRQLAVNPLLLLMIILVFKYEQGGIPNSRGQLFDRIARGLLGEWKLQAEVKMYRNYWSEDKHVLLQQLGYAMKDEGLELSIHRAVDVFQATVEKKPDRFSSRNPHRPPGHSPLGAQTDWMELVGELKRDRILLQTRDPGIIRFWHQTIQEYFAAYYIWNEVRPLFERGREQGRLPRATLRSLKQRLDCYIDDPRWHEILAIVSGLIPVKVGREALKTADWMVVKFMDRVWRRNRLLAAMCLSNVEQFSDATRLAGYVRRLQRDIYLWGIVLPKLYPWFLLAALLATVWLIPQEAVESLLNLAQNRPGLSDMAAQIIGATLAIAFGSVAVLLFFRLCALGIQKFETFTNERFIRSGISALRYIRNEAAERLLAEFSARIANDFSIGDTTRLTIQTGLVLPVRDESELILMLGNEKTRLQAMERLAELGSERAIIPLRRILDQAGLHELSYANAIRSLVRIIRLQPSHSQSRRDIESQLRELLLSSGSASYSKRLSAYRGLLDLGIADVKPPQRDMADAIRVVVAHWRLVAVLAFLLLVLLLVYIAYFRLDDIPWRY